MITPVEEELTTKGGLLLSGEDKEKFRYKRGLVVAVGTDVRDIMGGDSIYYSSRSGYTMLIDNSPHTIISEPDVVVVL